MRIEPRLDEIVHGKRGMLRGIAVSLESQCLVSAVGLMFMTVDALAALTRPIERSSVTRGDFIEWCDRYLDPENTLRCRSTDLYAARCGVLHAYSSESDLQRKGEARRVLYQWRGGPAPDQAISLPPESIVVIVEDLHEALLKAVRSFVVASEMDVAVRERVQKHLSSLLCYAPWPHLQVEVAA
jgi:hypothetical protein